MGQLSFGRKDTETIWIWDEMIGYLFFVLQLFFLSLSYKTWQEYGVYCKTVKRHEVLNVKSKILALLCCRVDHPFHVEINSSPRAFKMVEKFEKYEGVKTKILTFLSMRVCKNLYSTLKSHRKINKLYCVRK